jgi:hypothetical protein
VELPELLAESEQGLGPRQALGTVLGLERELALERLALASEALVEQPELVSVDLMVE